MLDESSPNQEAEPVNVEATLKEFRTSLKIQNLREAVELSLAVMQTVQVCFPHAISDIRLANSLFYRQCRTIAKMHLRVLPQTWPMLYTWCAGSWSMPVIKTSHKAQLKIYTC